MSHYSLNEDKLFEKAIDRQLEGGGKENAAEYYLNNRQDFEKCARNKHRSQFDEEKEVKRTYRSNRYRRMGEDEKNRLKEYQRNYEAAKKKKNY